MRVCMPEKKFSSQCLMILTACFWLHMVVAEGPKLGGWDVLLGVVATSSFVKKQLLQSTQ